MGKSKFIKKIKNLFGIEVEAPEPDKEVVKDLVDKLKLRKIELKRELKECTDIPKREALKDSVKILNKQIKKGKDLL